MMQTPEKSSPGSALYSKRELTLEAFFGKCLKNEDFNATLKKEMAIFVRLDRWKAARKRSTARNKKGEGKDE